MLYFFARPHLVRGSVCQLSFIILLLTDLFKRRLKAELFSGT